MKKIQIFVKIVEKKLDFKKKNNKFCDDLICKKKSFSIGGQSNKNKIKILKCENCEKFFSVGKTSWKLKVCPDCKKDIKNKRCLVYFRKCWICKKYFTTKNACENRLISEKKYICSECVENKENYYKQSQFKFSLSEFPDKFDLSLFKSEGVYHPIMNPNGISRDHIIPISWGYLNKIDPKIISHPANCELMKHKENQAKGKKIIFSLNELLEKIKNW